jgi:ParB family chromosome partitioning protein
MQSNKEDIMENKKNKKKLVRANSLQNKVGGLTVVTSDDVKEKKELIQKIPLKDILEPKVHDRKSFSKEEISSLARNIQATKMLLQPIVVRKIDDKFERIIGFRRIEAVKELGWKEIPAIVLKDISDEEAMLIMLSENIQRENLNVFDQTVGIMEYIGLAFQMSFDDIKKLLYHFRNVDSKTISSDLEKSEIQREKMEAITQKLGNISVATLINRLKMFTFQELILDAMKKGEISYTAALELNKISDEQEIKKFIKALSSGECSIKEIKAFIKNQKKHSVTHHSLKYKVESSDNGVVLSIEEPLNEKQLKKLEKFLNTL